MAAMMEKRFTAAVQAMPTLDLVKVKAPSPRRRDGFYYLDGRRYVSVTNVLGVLAKPQLVYWAAKTSASLVLEDPTTFDTSEKAAAGIYQARDKAADRGSLVHSLAEAFARRAPVDRDNVPDHVRGYADAFWGWVAAVQPTPLFTESNVYSDRYGYAGTFDLLCALPNKQLVLVDLKTTKNIYAEAGLQLAAYRHADFIVPHTDDRQRIPMPPVTVTAVVLLSSDGTFTYKEVRGDLEVFLALKRVYEWTKAGA